MSLVKMWDGSNIKDNKEKLALRRKEIEKMLMDLDKQENFEASRVSCLQKILDFAFADTDSTTFVKKEVENVVITGPTQMGKTSYILDTISACVGKSMLSVFVCDNSKDQLLQLSQRLNSKGLKFYLATSLNKSTVKKINVELKNKENVLIIMLNNSSQIQKLTNAVSTFDTIGKYCVFLDEGDNVNKTDDLIGVKSAESQKKWKTHMGLVSGVVKNGITKYWISATPDNCFFLHSIKISNTCVLPISPDYVGVNSHCNWSGDLEAVRTEVERVKLAANGEFILYCMETLKEDHRAVSKEMSAAFDCLCLCYNGDGLVLYNGGAVVMGIGASSIGGYLTRIKDLAIRRGLIVVGHRLMDRGISFVSLDPILPLTATVMFYKGGVKTQLVSLAQRFGRITGTSRPDLLVRKIYCLGGVYEDYIGYLGNLAIAIKELGSFEYVKENYSKEGVVMIKRALDKVGLASVNRGYKECCSVGAGGGGVVVDMDLEKMQRLVSSWRLESNATGVARLFRKMVADGGKILSGDVKDYMLHNSNIIIKDKGWNTVFRKIDGYHYIRDEALEYLATL